MIVDLFTAHIRAAPDSKREVREVSVDAEVIELLQLTVRVLAVFPVTKCLINSEKCLLLILPVEFPPLVPEGEAVGLEPVLVYSLEEVGGGSPLDTATLAVVRVTRSHQAPLVHSDPCKIQTVQSRPNVLCDVPLQQEDKLEVCLVPDILQAAYLECLEVARIRLRTEPKSLQFLQSVILKRFCIPLTSQNLENISISSTFIFTSNLVDSMGMFQLRIDSYLSSLLLSKLSATSGLDQSQEFSTRPCDLHQLIQGDYSLIPVVAGVSLYIGLFLSQALQFCQREVEAEPVGDVSLVVPVDVIIVVVHVVGGKSVLKLRSLGDISSEVKVRFVGADKLVILQT